MSDAVDRGITVTEIAAMDQPIDVSPETTVAFVGRALRGPLNTPVLVQNFGEFRRRFGDVWARSSLGPAAKQFFEHGGRRLLVVRVANNARGAMLCLPASGSALVLRAVEPGSTEFIRAAIDYDGLDDDNEDLFNLTLQRVNPATGHVVDQEFFRQLSWQEDADGFVASELLPSRLARAEPPYPTHRPEATAATGSGDDASYIDPRRREPMVPSYRITTSSDLAVNARASFRCSRLKNSTCCICHRRARARTRDPWQYLQQNSTVANVAPCCWLTR